jgi:uncharacterized LabA/DUF88 family protein
MKIVYIDAQNIHKSIKDLWWIIDWKLFYDYLQEKYTPDRVLVFLWYIQKYKHIYDMFISAWYEIIFKEVLVRFDGSIKWDVDIDIAIHAIKHLYERDITWVFLVTWDADYNSLIYERQVAWIFEKLLVPNLDNTLYILRKASGWKLQPLTDIKHKIAKKQKDWS